MQERVLVEEDDEVVIDRYDDGDTRNGDKMGEPIGDDAAVGGSKGGISMEDKDDDGADDSDGDRIPSSPKI